ncbi:DUF4864 domain-containing protein [Bradyrhizobium sp. STM 3557]|uniref:DUF4864 domain-containing protein n=1 Tax=Bradyrhizobium sp. STM 3557 TaxID=578920 RepID=UPI00388FA3BF
MRMVLLLLALLVAAPAFAIAADDATPAQNAIRQQERAFARDDAAAAYAQAAPEIHAIFPSPDIFMAMVRQGYAPVYRHQSFEFGESRTEGGVVAQRVHIIDAKGEAWEALYTLETQPDGSLKITGCSLLKAADAV